MGFHKDVLGIDCDRESERIGSFIKQYVRSSRRDGAVVGLSGGIDSALCAALCVKALGKERVFGLVLPEKESNPVSDEEFYFRIPYTTLDLLLYAWEHKIPIEQICETMGLTEAQVKRAQRDFKAKYNATRGVRQSPPTLE